MDRSLKMDRFPGGICSFANGAQLRLVVRKKPTKPDVPPPRILLSLLCEVRVRGISIWRVRLVLTSSSSPMSKLAWPSPLSHPTGTLQAAALDECSAGVGDSVVVVERLAVQKEHQGALLASPPGADAQVLPSMLI